MHSNICRPREKDAGIAGVLDRSLDRGDKGAGSAYFHQFLFSFFFHVNRMNRRALSDLMDDREHNMHKVGAVCDANCRASVRHESTKK